MMNKLTCFLLTLAVPAGMSAAGQQVSLQTAEPPDHGRALVNPQMGWTMHFYSNIIEKINRRIGYRIQLKKATFPAQIQLSEPFAVTSTWSNAGVAPCYPGGFVAYTLKNEQGGIVAAFCDESFNVRDLPVGPPGEAPARTIRSTFAVAMKTYGYAPNTQPGTCDLYVSVGLRDGTPVIALPHENDDGHRRYKLGTIALLPSDS